MNTNVLNGHGLYKYINLTTVLILIQIVVVKRTYKLYFVCVWVWWRFCKETNEMIPLKMEMHEEKQKFFFVCLKCVLV